jgi:hypothetical protein
LVQCWCFVFHFQRIDYPLIDPFVEKEPPPEKSVSHKPQKNKQNGGPGSFVPHAGLDLYDPPYERNRLPQVDTLVQEFNEFGVSERHPASFPVSIFHFHCPSG